MNTVLNRRDMTRGVHRVVHCTCVPNRIARCYARQLISKSDGIELLGCRSWRVKLLSASQRLLRETGCCCCPSESWNALRVQCVVFISVHFVAALLPDCTASHVAFVLGRSGKSSEASVCTGAWKLRGNEDDWRSNMTGQEVRCRNVATFVSAGSSRDTKCDRQLFMSVSVWRRWGGGAFRNEASLQQAWQQLRPIFVSVRFDK